MPVQAVFLFLFSLAASLSLIGWVMRLRARYSTGYFDPYLIFVAVTAIYGLINWVGPFLVLAIAGETPQPNPMWLMATFVLFGTPILMAKLAAFLALLTSMNARHLPGRLIQVLIIGSAITVLASILAVKAYFDGHGLAALRIFAIVFGGCAISIQVFALLYVSIRPAFRGGLDRTSGRNWALAHLTGLFVYILTAYAPVLGLGENTVNAAPYLYYLMHLPPLLILEHHLRQSGIPRLSDRGHISSAAERFNLTRRESEILNLVINGHSNAIIADQLCVSPHTVKNHIYNIYQKIGVKSRIQLAALLLTE